MKKMMALLALSTLAGCATYKMVASSDQVIKARDLLNQKDYAGCLKEANGSVRRSPRWAAGYDMRANCLFKLGKENDSKALTDLQQAVYLDASFGASVYPLMGIIYCRQKNIEAGMSLQAKMVAAGSDLALAKKVARACARLAHPAPKVDAAEEKAFAAEAARYRALKVKPALPEEARRFKIQAESAIKDKRFERAIERYTQALEMVPWWPEGHFNRALILGESQRYIEAIREMKRYLALVPGAADARKAQDKIYAWEDK